MAKSKAAGKGMQHVSPSGKRLGLKVSDGQKVKTGAILVRQRGGDVKCGDGVKKGKDFTLFAAKDGIAKYSRKLGRKLVAVV